MMHILQHTSTLLVMLFFFNQGACMQDGIVGGHEAAPHSRPYMVFIVYIKHKQWKECNGFLVREDFVMSAAHCKGENMLVFPGLHDKSHLKQHPKVRAKPFVHPSYEGTENDIMLLKLAKNVRLGDKVNLVALPEAENEDPLTAHCLVPGAEYKDLPTADCMVPGWGGIDYENGIVSDVLQEVNVTVGTSLNCETASKLCTIGPGGPVEGYSGRPLVCGKVARGVASYSNGKGKTRTLYYTRIAHYRDWIDDIMNMS